MTTAWGSDDSMDEWGYADTEAAYATDCEYAARGGGDAALGAAALSLFDLHCHLDFGEDPQALAADLRRVGIGCLSATVTPDAYQAASCVLAPYDNVRVGLGLHPWWAADGAWADAQLEAFEQMAADARFVAEVGLDFGSQHAASQRAQVAAFERVVKVCATEGDKVMSVHAVKSAETVLDLLERSGALACNQVVFHWFSGTSDELQRAVRVGCFFSVNPRMLASKRGHAYASAVPVERLLLETDEPSCPGAPADALATETALKGMISQLAALRHTGYDDLEARIAHTSRELLGLR